MTQRALVFGGIVHDLRPVGGDFPVHSNLTWHDAPDAVAVGWGFDGVTFSAPPPPPAPPTNEEIYDQVIRTQKTLKAVVLAFAAGSVKTDGSQTNAQIKAAVVAKM